MGDVVPDATKLAGTGQSSIDTSKKWVGQDCGQVIQELNDKVKSIVDGKIKEYKKEASTVEEDHKVRKSGGLWDKITGNSWSNLSQTAKDAMTNPKDQASAQQGYMGKFNEYLDKGQQFAGLASELVSSVSSGIVEELPILNAVSESLGFGVLQPNAQGAGCEKSLVLGTIDSVVSIVGGVASNTVSAVSAAQATVAMAFDVVPELYGALANLPVGTLSVLLTNKKTLLARIEGVVSASLALSIKMTADDYPMDHKSFVLAAQAKLEESDSNLAQVQSTLEAGGNFLKPLWDQTRKTVGETGEDLLGGGKGELRPGFTHIKIIQLIGYQAQLVQLVQILTERQKAFSMVLSSIGQMKTTFDSEIKFQNLMTPIVKQVRCSIQQIVSDMDQVMDADALLRYYLKEKKWGVDLCCLASFMYQASMTGNTLAKPSNALNDAADTVSTAVGGSMDFFQNTESYDALAQYLNSYSSELKRKATRNVDAGLLNSISKAVQREIDKLKASDSQLEKVLNNFNSTVAGAGLTALQAVSGVMSLLDEQGLDGMTEALKNGDFKSFFSGDMLKKQAESAARKALGEVMQCCAQNQGDGDVQEKVIKTNRILQAMQKGKDFYEQYTLGFSTKHLKEVHEKIIPQLTQMKKDVAAMGQARCMNKGKQGTLSPAGLTLI